MILVIYLKAQGCCKYQVQYQFRVFANVVLRRVGDNFQALFTDGKIIKWCLAEWKECFSFEERCPRIHQDLTTQFFPLGRTTTLQNDILMFQQHQCESLSEAWTRFKDLLQKVPHHGIDIWLQVQIFYDHVNPATRRTIDHSANGKLRDRNGEESWALLEDLALYDIKS
ncbi:zinc finger, CCHC-type containing protein [Tanacetum coccineum]